MYLKLVDYVLVFMLYARIFHVHKLSYMPMPNVLDQMYCYR